MALPEPSFITRDVDAITAEMVARYEAATGKTLFPAQVERVLINLIAYRENLLRIGIQEAAKQNLVEYAVFPMLDYLGELVGVVRLDAQAARCTIRFTLTAVQAFDVAVPSGTRVETKDGTMIFETEGNLIIAAGATYGDVSAVCQAAGIAGNGYAAGEVNGLLDVVANVAGAANTTTSTGGSDEESDDALRARIKLAPEKYTNAGSYGAYRYWAFTAHPNVIAVAVTSPQPGSVNIYPLASDGTPSQAILDAVAGTCSAETVRPLCDSVSVLAPTKKDFVITANLTLFDTADGPTVQAAVESALDSFASMHRATLGRDVVLTQIIAAINSVTGVYKVALASPSADVVNAENEWSNCTAITVNITGYTNG
ncbi:MAG: baseplate protein [Chlorobiaceae bacterium]|nr:baseplate protein [Chlorobiaceae bacterium]